MIGRVDNRSIDSDGFGKARCLGVDRRNQQKEQGDQDDEHRYELYHSFEYCAGRPSGRWPGAERGGGVDRARRAGVDGK